MILDFGGSARIQEVWRLLFGVECRMANRRRPKGGSSERESMPKGSFLFGEIPSLLSVSHQRSSA
jgi:hypothetical protein